MKRAKELFIQRYQDLRAVLEMSMADPDDSAAQRGSNAMQPLREHEVLQLAVCNWQSMPQTAQVDWALEGVRNQIGGEPTYLRLEVQYSRRASCFSGRKSGPLHCLILALKCWRCEFQKAASSLELFFKELPSTELSDQ